MFKYIKFNKVKSDLTTYAFKRRDEAVVVNFFNIDVVSIQSEDEVAITELIISQESCINCEEITKEEFKELVKDSFQLERIRTIVKERIATKYSVADEIAMMKKSITDKKRVDYDAYVEECISIGDELKAEIGY